MSQDPYGFQSAAPTGEGSQAMWMGVIASLLTAVGACFCYLPYFVALPLGIYAMVKGSRSMSVESPDGRSMATAGMVSGGVAAVVSGLFVLFIVTYLLFIVAMMVVGALGGSGDF